MTTVSELQEYSFAFNVKLLAVHDLGDSESAVDTSELFVKLFNSMGAQVSINDIDIAHRVPFHDTTRGGPKPIICKFTRRLARNQVMAVGKEARKVPAINIGLEEEDDLSNVSIVDYLKAAKAFC